MQLRALSSTCPSPSQSQEHHLRFGSLCMSWVVKQGAASMTLSTTLGSKGLKVTFLVHHGWPAGTVNEESSPESGDGTAMWPLSWGDTQGSLVNGLRVLPWLPHCLPVLERVVLLSPPLLEAPLAQNPPVFFLEDHSYSNISIQYPGKGVVDLFYPCAFCSYGLNSTFSPFEVSRDTLFSPNKS